MEGGIITEGNQAFDKVIGYESIKKELYQIVDMVKHPARYQALGAELPHGLLLYGVPGIGKSLLAQCLIEACGLPSFVLRKTEAEAEQIKAINKAYQSAIDKAPAM